MIQKKIFLQTKKNKKLYFAGDFHLGRPDRKTSTTREKKIISWLNSIKNNAQEIFLLGDIFDFWFEYKNVIPKDNLRFLSTISEMIDNGIHFHYFVGNHDLWVRDYFKELGITIYKEPIEFIINDKLVLIGHGDGIGPGDTGYKILKKIFFTNKIFQIMFRWIHPDMGLPIGRYLSGSKKKMNITENAKKNDERIIKYCKDYLVKKNITTFIFGHSHFKNKKSITNKSVYYNCGEWINGSSYLEYDSKEFKLLDFKN